MPEMNAFMPPDRYSDPESGHLSAYFSKLFILIGQESFQYCILDTEKNTFVSLADFRLSSSPLTPEAFYPKISRLFLEEEALKKKYPSVVIGIDTAFHTLVPAPLFDSDKSAKYLDFNFGIKGNEQVCTNKIEELDAYNIFSLPAGITEILRTHFSDAALFHRTSALIKAIYNHQKINPADEGLFLNVRKQFIDLVSFEGGRLAYFNSFLCPGKEDMLYYTLNALEQLNLRPDNVQLFISGILDNGSDAHRMLEQYIHTVSFSEKLSFWNYSPLLNQLPAHRYQELFALALCGS